MSDTEYYKKILSKSVNIVPDPDLCLMFLTIGRKACELIYLADVNAEERRKLADALLQILEDEVNQFGSLKIMEVEQ